MSFTGRQSENLLFTLSCFLFVFLTHFQVLVHQSVSVHGLQVPVFVPLRQLRFVLHVLTSPAPFLHLPARPPVLQQAEHGAPAALPSPQSKLASTERRAEPPPAAATTTRGFNLSFIC